MDRILDPTGCYFGLADTISPAPLGLEGHIYRFLCDQQACVLWYLYLPPHGVPVVLASPDMLEELDQSDKGAIERAARETLLVAHSFAEFLYRFWMEGMLWFKITHKVPLSAAEAAYAGPELG
jgi:hypothetical protein